MTRRISDEQIADIRRLHAMGGSQHSVSAQVGVSQQTVSYYVRTASGEAEGDLKGRIAQFEIPDRLDPESVRVIEYVNSQIARWNAGRRTEPLDPILTAARERLRRSSR
jgi:hypothetical protein